MNKTITINDIKLVRQVINYESDYNHKLEIQDMYMTPCNTVGYPTQYYTKEKLLEQHVNCDVCNFKYTKRANGLTDHLLLEIFGNNIKVDRKLTSRNFTIEYLDDGSTLLKHNGRFEYLRRVDGLLIHNSEHEERTRSMMGSHVSCPSFWRLENSLIQIPLTTIAREYFESQWDEQIFLEICDNIQILDNATDGYIYSPKILFKIKSHRLGKEIYLMHLRDEQHNYLIELPKPVNTVKQAETDLIPTIALKSGEYTRQGDLFFIPLKDIPKDSIIEKQHFQKSFSHLEYNIAAQTAIMQVYKEIFPKNENIRPNDINRRFLKEMEENRDKILKDNPKLKAIYDIADKYLQDVKGELVKSQIYETNHNAQFSTNIGMVQIVKGWITHNNKDHHRIKLESWHLVVFNQQKNSFMVDVNRRGAD